jgi:hypothetical protein
VGVARITAAAQVAAIRLERTKIVVIKGSSLGMRKYTHTGNTLRFGLFQRIAINEM